MDRIVEGNGTADRRIRFESFPVIARPRAPESIAIPNAVRRVDFIKFAVASLPDGDPRRVTRLRALRCFSLIETLIRPSAPPPRHESREFHRRWAAERIVTSDRKGSTESRCTRKICSRERANGGEGERQRSATSIARNARACGYAMARQEDERKRRRGTRRPSQRKKRFAQGEAG